MKPVEFEHQTTLLNPPREGMKRGECGALPVIIFNEPGQIPVFASFWKPSAEDLAKLNAGEHIRLNVFGFAHPPVWIEVERCAELP